jgi:beta-lactamase superfamily II metal-dependent hydrolase
MGRARLWPLALVSLALVCLFGCSEKETNPFDPAQDREPPVVTAFAYSGGEAQWSTDEEALCVLEYGPVGGDYDHYVYESTKYHSTYHRASLLEAAEGEEYQVRIRSLDRAGNEGYDETGLPETVVARANRAETMTLSMIDVGWGLSMVLTTPDGSNVLIDAAREERLDDVVTFLEEHGISYFDAAIATHHHGDHVGGYNEDPGIIDMYWIGDFVAPDRTTLYIQMWPTIQERIEDHSIDITYVRQGDSSRNTPALAWDSTPGFGVEVLAAGLGGRIGGPEDTGDEGMKGNNDSMVLKITFEGVSFITTGDAEFYTEYAALDAYGRDGIRADLVQVGHHGNDDATSELWLDNVSPRIALISNAMIDASLEKEVVLQGIRAVDGDYFITDRIRPNTPRDAHPVYGNVIAVTDGETIEIVLEEHER